MRNPHATVPPRSVVPRSRRLAEPTRRVNITMLESQHDELAQRGVNVSGLIRELVDQYLSARTITLEVDADTRAVYEEVVLKGGTTPAEVGVRLRRALSDLLDNRLNQLAALRRDLVRK